MFPVLLRMLLVCDLFLILVSDIWTSAADICSLKNNQLALHRDFKTGETACCLPISCTPGHEVVLCEKSKPYSARCRACPDGTYQSEATDSTDMRYCDAKQTCSGRLTLLREGSSEEDAVCTCNWKRGFCHRNGTIELNNSRLCDRKSCPKQTQLTSDCQCEMCPVGMRKNKAGQQMCKRMPQKKNRCRKKGLLFLEGSELSRNNTLCPPKKKKLDAIMTNRRQIDDESNLTIYAEKDFSLPNEITTTSAAVDHHLRSVVSREITFAAVLEEPPPSSSHYYWFVRIGVPLIAISTLIVLIIVVKFYLRHRNAGHSEEKIKIEDSIKQIDTERSHTESFNEGERLPLVGKHEPSIENIQKIVSINCTNEEDRDNFASSADVNDHPGCKDRETAVKSVVVDASDTGDLPALHCLTERHNLSNFEMSPADKEKLRINRVQLIKQLYLQSEFYSLLLTSRTITEEMRSKIDRPNETKFEKAERLVDLLPSRGPNAFKMFLVAIVLTDQVHIAKTLDGEMTEKIQRLDKDEQCNLIKLGS